MGLTFDRNLKFGVSELMDIGGDSVKKIPVPINFSDRLPLSGMIVGGVHVNSILDLDSPYYPLIEGFGFKYEIIENLIQTVVDDISDDDVLVFSGIDSF